MSQKYDTCPKCGKAAVHLCTSAGVVLFGDEDDNQGNESEYADQDIYTEIIVGAHICMECEEIENTWIETPHHGDDERILNWLQEQTRQALGAGTVTFLVLGRVHLGEDLREVVKELMREPG